MKRGFRVLREAPQVTGIEIEIPDEELKDLNEAEIKRLFEKRALEQARNEDFTGCEKEANYSVVESWIMEESGVTPDNSGS